MPIRQVKLEELPHDLADKYIAPAWNYKTVGKRHFSYAWKVLTNLWDILKVKLNRVWAGAFNKEYINNESIINAANLKLKDVKDLTKGIDPSTPNDKLNSEISSWLKSVSTASDMLKSRGAINDADKISNYATEVEILFNEKNFEQQDHQIIEFAKNGGAVPKGIEGAYSRYQHTSEDPEGRISLLKGCCCQLGIGGVEKDEAAARALFGLAARKGNIDAMMFLADNFSKSNEKEADAKYWYGEAAAKGHPKAIVKKEEYNRKERERLEKESLIQKGEQFEQAQIYLKAEELYTMAASKQHPKAFEKLGDFYQKVKKDTNTAYTFYLKGALLGSVDCADKALELSTKAPYVRQEQTDQLFELYKMIASDREWVFTPLLNKRRMNPIKEMDEMNPEKTFQWSIDAAKQGHVDALSYLEVKNVDKAIECYKIAAENCLPKEKRPDLMYTLATILIGDGDRNKEQEGLQWLQRAADLGHPQAKQDLHLT